MFHGYRREGFHLLSEGKDAEGTYGRFVQWSQGRSEG